MYNPTADIKARRERLESRRAQCVARLESTRDPQTREQIEFNLAEIDRQLAWVRKVR